MIRRLGMSLMAFLVLLVPALRADGPPTAVALIAPTGMGVSATPTYTWNALLEADDYYLWVNNSAGAPVLQGWYSASSVCNGTTCSVTPATSLSRGYFTWWIQARNAFGTGPWSAGLGFTVGSVPAAPTLLGPSGTGIQTTPTYAWHAVADADAYYLWVNNAAGVPVVQEWHDASLICATDCSVTPSVPLPPGYATWWVQARNASGDGPWSAGMSFTVGSLPSPATLVSPSTSGVSMLPTYTWNAVTGATDYYLWVNNAAGTPVVQAWLSGTAVCLGSTCSATPATVLTPGSKTWWIQTRNASGDGAWSTAMSFIVGELPGVATLVDPTGAGIGASPVFRWNTVATATDYELWVNGPGGGTVVDSWYAAGNVCVANSCSVAPSQTLIRGAHQWWIRARNQSGDGAWSAAMSFTVGDVPGAPVPRSPSGPTATASPTYSWDPVPDTDEYYLWVNGPSGTPVVQNHYSAAGSCDASACSVKPATPLGSGGHTWWVQARNDSGDGPWSAGMSFSVVAAGSVGAGSYSSFALTPERSLWAWGANSSGQLGLGSTDEAPAPTLVSGIADTVAVAGGESHAVLLRSDGTVWTSGSNYDGQLGRPGADSSNFEQVPGLTGVVQIASGGSHVLALRADGTVYAWGANYYGQLGNGSLEPSSSPVPIDGLSSVVAVAAGASHSIALRSDGTVVAWGANASGQLGDGTNDSRATPAAIAGLASIRRIATGPTADHSFAVAADGSLYAWGANYNGQLGDGTAEEHLSPVLVVGLTGVTHVAAGAVHSLAVLADGSLWSWGDNFAGQLGTDAAGVVATPGMLISPTGIVAIGAGSAHSVALTSDGRVLSWGDNTFVQLGTAHSVPSTFVPIELSGSAFQWLTQRPVITPPGGQFANSLNAMIESLTAGATLHYTDDGSEPTEASPVVISGETIGIDASKTIRVRAWKDGFQPSATVTATFVLEAAAPRANPPGGTYSGRVHVGLASETTDAEIRYTTDGTEPTTSSPLYGGLLTLTSTTTLNARAFRGTWNPSPTSTYSYTILPPTGAVAAGQSFSLSLDPSGSVRVWGAGSAGQLGNGLTLDSLEPIAVEGVTDVVAIAAGGGHALALRGDGTLLSWGDGVLTPVVISGLDAVIAIAAGGGHSLALRSDGRVYAWGANTFGQLGDGTTADRALAQPVPDLVNVVAIAAGGSHSLALGADGRVWAWGDNAWGQIGNGSTAVQLVPVVVLSDAIGIAAGTHHSLAVKSDGSGWAWGRNDRWQLSTAEGSDPLLPARVEQGWCDPEDHACYTSTLSSIRRFAGGGVHTLAITEDAHLWSGGGDDTGQLGRYERELRNPLALTPLEDVVAFAAGGDHSLALTATGEIWGWGGNARGQVGDCTTTNRTFPWKVSATGFAFVGCQPPPPPTLSLAGGTYTVNERLAVAISSPVDGSVIRYTLDGSDPDENSTPIATGAEVFFDESLTLKARAWASFGAAGDVASATYVLRAASPVFLPPAGDYDAQQQVVIASPTPSAVVRFTSDGSVPNATSPTAGGVIAVSTSTILTAIAISEHTSWLPSEAAVASYRLHFGLAPTPTFSPLPGTYSSVQAVAISTLAGGTVHYTLDGSTPTAASPVYAGPVAVDTTTTIRAFVVHPDYEPGPAAFATYRLKAQRPALTLGTGTYQGPQVVGVTLEGWTGSIHFTTNGVDPTLVDASISSGGTIPVNASLTLKVRAFNTGWLPSDVVAANYSIYEDTVGAVVATPAGGDYSTAVDVSLATTTAGAVVRYTLDGTEPGPASAVYSEPVHLAQTTTLKAKAFRGGWVPSQTLSALYQLGDRIASPILSPPSGIYATARSVKASCATPETTLRYTLDGSEPTEASPTLLPESEISVDRTTRVRVQAFKAGTTSSAVTTGDYQITGAVAAGNAHSLALRADGSVWAWGANEAGQLGLGTANPVLTPAQVLGVATVEQIAAGRAHSLALTADGSVWAWGANGHGQLGDGTLEDRPAPVEVAGGWAAPVVAIAAGDDFSLALSSDGTLWSWGANADGQLADGTTQDRSAPGASIGLSGIVSLAAGGSHALALDGSGHVWAWGRNTDGQLGDGTTASASQPVVVSFEPTAPLIMRLAAGQSHSAAVDSAGGLWTWGRNADGQLGHAAPPPSQLSPARLIDTVRFVVPDGGQSHSIALVGTGEVLAWGRNDAGQLGDGSSTSNPNPLPVVGLEEVVRVAAGARHSLAITAEGLLWAWGANESGQLGDGTTVGRRLPVASALDRLVSNQAVNEDPDADGLSTAAEYRLGTDPFNRDTNGDGVPDGVSAGSAADASNDDPDGDGLTNDMERILGTDPLRADTDGDGFPDGIDLFPLDPSRWSLAQPVAGDVTAPTITIWDPRNAVRIP